MRIRPVIRCLSLLWLSATWICSAQEGTFGIAGVVLTADRNAVPDASVRLQPQGNGHAEEQKTDTAGRFVFSGLKPGTYVVSASKEEEHSAEISVRGRSGATERVELTLADVPKAAAGNAESKRGKAGEIEFSDVPNFTVAAVTDWTAAGGHGSDTSLRTSEALTRDALQLKAEPKSAPSMGQDSGQTERRLREAQQRLPRDPSANEDLGRFYLNAERYAEAVAPLQSAYELAPEHTDYAYALALALARSGHPGDARAHVNQLLAKGEKPEWRRLAGELDEKLGDPLDAVHDFERAAQEDPSEENYFAWGTELLEHRAIWQAKDVFAAGVNAHPHSVRLLTALGTAFFSAARYQDAAQRLCEASDLNPNDADPYLFMGRVEIAAPDPLPCIETKLKRFVELQPANALANYYYAMAYWKQHGKKADPAAVNDADAFLTKAVEDDPKCSSAYLQLGIIRASLSEFDKAAEFYRKAIAADPTSTEAHYRLGVAYDRLGQKEKAAEEFRLHDDLEKQQAAAVDRQRREVKQFLVLVGGDKRQESSEP